MDLSFFFGPDKISFQIDKQGVIEPGFATPFHGIISRGLLEALTANGSTYDHWFKFAHLLDSTVVNTEPDLILLQQYARAYKVLSFGDSACCARKYIERYCSRPENLHYDKAELWNIKEGHTSSVWRVCLTSKHHQQHEIFILNVARDEAAGIELRTTSEKMQAIAQNCADINMAKVYDITTVNLEHFNEFIDVVITRNEWIPDSYEIHLIRSKGSNEQQYTLVERFMSSEENPSIISSIRGRKFTRQETHAIENGLQHFLKMASDQFSTHININDGDLVWDGQKAVVVAIS